MQKVVYQALRRPAVIVLVMLLSCLPAAAQESGRFKVVELFTSQACPNSPDADATLLTLRDRDDVLALSLPITYWDYFGWKDTLANPAHDDRQERYVEALHDQWLYTPQMVINGRHGLSGDDIGDVETALRDAMALPRLTVVSTTEGMRVSLPVTDPDTAEMVLTFVAWDPDPISVDVGSGKNAGKTLTYGNVVRVLDTMVPTGASAIMPRPEKAQGLPCALILQDRKTGEMIAAGRCPGPSV